MKKSIVSLILVFAMLFTMFPVNVFSVSKSEKGTVNQSDAQIEQSEITMESDNSFGNIISNAMQEKQNSQDSQNENDNYIKELSIENNVADVSFAVAEDSVVRVDICDEKTKKVITSGVASVEADSETAQVEIYTNK